VKGAAVLTGVVAAAALAAGAPLRATLTAPGHSPKVSTRWSYTVRATRGGRPAAARLTAQILDPLGGVHPVELGLTTTKIVRRPFRGRFSDFVIWPRSSRGVPLKLRLIVTAGSSRRVITYAVVPRA
jgi:hypothetical protein